MTRKFWKIRFLQKISKQIVFFYVKLEFRMFSAFIWYTYCLCRKKMADFQIFHTKSKQIFKVKLGYFGAPFWQNYTFQTVLLMNPCQILPEVVWKLKFLATGIARAALRMVFVGLWYLPGNILLYLILDNKINQDTQNIISACFY